MAIASLSKNPSCFSLTIHTSTSYFMGYLSCNAESAIATCDPYNWDLTKNKHRITRAAPPFQVRHFSYTDLQSATNGFSDSNFLGKGSHGSVYKAILDNGKLVAAVKRTILSSCANTPADNEIEILSIVRSPRLVNLLGFSFDSSDRKLIVVEFMPNGSLYDLLHTVIRPPGWTRRVRVALQVAKAVRVLHLSNPPVIHRDIKSSNVLLDDNWNAKLGDFGLSVRGHVEDVRITCTPPAGTLGYLDPGYLSPGDLTSKSDVFSFGILLLEIISGRNAIDMNFSPPSVVDWATPLIKSGDFAEICDPRIGLPEDLAALGQLAVVAYKCVRPIAEKRPAMTDVVEWLKSLRKRIRSPIWNNLRRRVRKSSPLIKYEGISKVSNVASVELSDEPDDVVFDRLAKSKSIGSSCSDTKLLQLDLNGGFGNTGRKRGGGLGVMMPSVRLSKSRSAGVLQGTRLVDKSPVIRNPNGIELENSKLLIQNQKPHVYYT